MLDRRAAVKVFPSPTPSPPIAPKGATLSSAGLDYGLDAERLLRDIGLRVTPPRRTVLAVVHEQPHSSTETVIEAVRQHLPTVSHQAVYDVLRALTDAGLLRRLQPAGSVARYEARVGDNHHHVVCRLCGAIADVDCALGAAPCLTASDDAGFVVDQAEVVYWGCCPDCSTSSLNLSLPSAQEKGTT
ncbi:MAG: transcriptional repressor [Pseudonocardiales bacterium]|nr:transcriptional repressor [Pseudonocardiales bacterium]